MSGIAGIYYLNGRPVAGEQVSRMVHRMEHRGPDAQRVWTSGSVGLGHGMLHTTPESLHETLPYTSSESNCTITADARIDNRDELSSALRIRPSSDEVIPDSTLILRAYEKWGEDCADHLLGDFVFAIWDKRKQRLFCARDHFGVRAFFYYHAPGQVFAFASEIKALLTLEEVPRRLNEVRLADYLAVTYEDKEITEYEEVRRLPPAHLRSVRPDASANKQYWSLEMGEPLELSSDAAYAERLLVTLRKAVECRIRSVYPVSSELSGGLDSSFVTCLARDLSAEPIHAVSALFGKTPASDEREYIYTVLEQSGDALIPQLFEMQERTSFLSALEEITSRIDEGVYLSGAHHYMWEQYRCASSAGARVHLTGIDGDSTIAHGTRYLLQLAEENNWKRFSSEVGQLIAKHAGMQVTQGFVKDLESPWKMVNRYARPFLEKLVEEQDYLTFNRAVGQISRHLPLGRFDLYRNFGRDIVSSFIPWSPQVSKSTRKSNAIGFLDPDFQQSIDYANRYRQLKRSEHYNSVRKSQLHLFRSGVFATTMEAVDQYSAAHSIQSQHPFMDKRLIELALRLPAGQSLGNGWTRWIMRRAMEGIVPEKVQWRREKADLTPSMMKQVLVTDEDLLQKQMLNPGPLGKYVDLKQYQSLYEKRKTLNERGCWRIKFLASLAFWMKCRWT